MSHTVQLCGCLGYAVTHDPEYAVTHDPEYAVTHDPEYAVTHDPEYAVTHADNQLHYDSPH